LTVLTIIGAIVDVIAGWRRQLAFLIIYIELFIIIVLTAMPFNFGDFKDFLLLLLLMLLFITLACDPLHNIIACFISVLICELGTFPLVHKDDMQFGRVVVKILTACLFILFLNIISMVINYIVQIQGSMSTLVIENLNLLNGMHEGLVVLSSSDKSL